jgi:ribonuclease PH
MDGHLTEEEFDEAFKLALKGCYLVSELQKKAILEKYKPILEAE